jgi:hypothetical protein
MQQLLCQVLQPAADMAGWCAGRLVAGVQMGGLQLQMSATLVLMAAAQEAVLLGVLALPIRLLLLLLLVLVVVLLCWCWSTLDLQAAGAQPAAQSCASWASTGAARTSAKQKMPYYIIQCSPLADMRR